MEHVVLVVLLAFFCEFIDSSLGMGYGTTLTPILLLLGYSPLETVPAVLASEALTGFSAAFVHHLHGNVHFDFANVAAGHTAQRWGVRSYVPRSRDSRVAVVLSLCSVVGATAAAILALRLPKLAVEIYIGVLVLGIGVFLLLRHRRPLPFRWSRVVGIGMIAAFNKGISGGGYGPLVTGGQMVAGLDSKSAIAITSFAEGIASVAGVAVYWISKGSVNWSLAPMLIVGAMASVPFTGLVVKRVSTRRLALVVAVFTVLLGANMLLKVMM